VTPPAGRRFFENNRLLHLPGAGGGGKRAPLMDKKPVVPIIRDGWGLNPGGRAPAEQAGTAVLLAKPPSPGVTRSLVFFPMKPGSYKFFDDFHPETGQGRIVAK